MFFCNLKQFFIGIVSANQRYFLIKNYLFFVKRLNIICMYKYNVLYLYSKLIHKAMLRIYQKDILKNGRLIASHTMMLIVKDEKELRKEEVKAQARYSMMINPPTVKLHARPIQDENIKDYGVQLKLF